MARKCKSCEITLFPMAKRKKSRKKTTRRRRRVGSSCSCKGLTVWNVLSGVAGGVSSLALSGVAKKLVINRISDEKTRSIATKALPVLKTAGAIYGSKKVKGANQKAAVAGFGVVSGLEIALNIPVVKKYASIGSSSDLFDMIGGVGDVVYLPIGEDGAKDNNQDFFTEESVVLGAGEGGMYTDIATL